MKTFILQQPKLPLCSKANWWDNYFHSQGIKAGDYLFEDEKIAIVVPVTIFNR